MKRLIIPGVIVIAMLALFQWGNRILASALDAKLPELLTNELGIQVTLDPVTTWIPKLAVHSPKLVMGNPANPALVATGVNISLDWSDLLRGEIRLRRATGATLMVNPSLWPGNDDPWPNDYSFIEPYLPDSLALESARYVRADEGSHTFTQPQWQRQATSVRLQWQDDWDGQAIGITAVLHSLQDLLQLARLDLEATATATGKDSSEITAELQLQPASSSGYDLVAKVTTAGMEAQLSSGSSTAWDLPTQSSTRIDSLDLGKIVTLIDNFRGEEADTGSDIWLKTNVPKLDWPPHKGQVSISKIRWQDEVALDNKIDFTTGPQGVTIPAITSRGPGGDLQGKGDIASSGAGWSVNAQANISANKTGQGLAAAYVESDWLWRTGSATVKGQGDTWGAMLNSLTGDIALAFTHRGAAATPVSITAKLDNRPGELALDKIDITLAQGHISGSVSFSGKNQKRLSARLNAEQIDLGFMIPASDPNAPPGLAVPPFLDALPEVELDWQLDINALTAQRVHISQAHIAIKRTAGHGSVTIRSIGAAGGKLDLQLAARMFPDKPSKVTLDAVLASFDFARVFQQATGALDTRTSGTIKLSSQGKGLEQVFEAMQGTADLTIDVRPDRDWKRAAKPQEKLSLTGEAALVMGNKRIAGLQVTRLVADNVLQNITGSVSMVDGRKPWLEADLVSDRLDVANLRQFQAQSQAQAETTTSSTSTSTSTSDAQPDPLQLLMDLGDARLSLKVETLKLDSTTLTKAAIQVSTGPDSVIINQMDFSLDQGQLTSHGGITWKEDEATLSLDASVTDLPIDNFLGSVPGMASAPLSGSISLSSAGGSTDSLLAGLSGDINLTASRSATDAKSGNNGGQIEMTARKTADGMLAVIHRFQWEGSDLSGSVQYHQTNPPQVDVEISGGALSLLPWEADQFKPAEKADKKDKSSTISSAAKTSASAVGSVVTAPLRLFSGPREAKPGKKLFSSTPLSFDWLKNNRVSVKGNLKTLITREATASDLTFSAQLTDGNLVAELNSGSVNKGNASLKVNLNVAQTPATLALNGSFRDLRGDLINSSDIPRSGAFTVSTQGQSQAEFAANMNGLVYLELGKGPIDYRNFSLLTTGVATTAFKTLIPGTEKVQPRLDCAVTLAVFKDGIGATPFGYAARTHEANLVGQINVNLKKELMHVNFSSSNRKGVGVSVSSVFSNTVEIEGPLSDPKIIPNATGLLWRGWAAVMTGGLSVLGESVVKRALASDDPCASVQKHIHKKFCGTPEAAGAPAMVCPPA